MTAGTGLFPDASTLVTGDSLTALGAVRFPGAATVLSVRFASDGLVEVTVQIDTATASVTEQHRVAPSTYVSLTPPF